MAMGIRYFDKEVPCRSAFTHDRQIRVFRIFHGRILCRILMPKQRLHVARLHFSQRPPPRVSNVPPQQWHIQGMICLVMVCQHEAQHPQAKWKFAF